MALALVAYDADSDSDVSDNEEDNAASAVQIVPQKSVTNGSSSSKAVDDNISDEEDFQPGPSSTAGVTDDFFEASEPDLISLISEKLPNAKLKSAQSSFVDEAEDVSTIPEKKDYGDKPEEPPAKKKKRQGPVQIVLPALEKLDEEEEAEKVKIQPSRTGSGLFSLLPAPKNSFTRKPTSSVLQSESVSKTPALSSTPNDNNLKPQGVRKVGLVPHRVANPVQSKPKVNKSDSEDDDDDDYLNVNSSSYFHETKTVPNPVAGPSININPVPVASVGSNSRYSYHAPEQTPVQSYGSEMLGPAVAPYPPPAPTYPEPGQFVESEEAIMRLAGKQNKMKELKEDPNMKIMDVHEDDMRGDPRVWLTKAMTEEQAPRPTGKGPKGLARSRHQITYLAHQAKERDWELRQDWATARENKRASASKYGF